MKRKKCYDIGGALSQVGNLITNWDDATKANDTTPYTTAYEAMGETPFSGDMSQLEAQYRGLNTDAEISKYQLGYLTPEEANKQQWGYTLSGAGLGYGLGSQLNSKSSTVNTVGKVAGTLLGGLAGNLIGRKITKETNENAEEAAASLANERQAAINRRRNNYAAAVDVADASNDRWLLSQYAAEGGPLLTNGTIWDAGFTSINEGGSHEANPLGGVPIGANSLVEEGEKIVNIQGTPFVFSKRDTLKNPDEFLLPKALKGKTFAEASEWLYEHLGMKENPNNVINKRGNTAMQERLAVAQETQKQSYIPMDNTYAKGGSIHIKPENRGKFNATKARTGKTTEELTHSKNPLTRKRAIFAQNAAKWKHATGGYLFDDDPDKPLVETNNTPFYSSVDTTYEPAGTSRPGYGRYAYLDIPEDEISGGEAKSKSTNGSASWLRYAPVIGSGINVLTDLTGITNVPDYTNANLIGNSVLRPQMVGYTPTGRYLNYNPIDRYNLLNRLEAQSAGNVRAAKDLSGGNRATALANIAAQEYANQTALGELGLNIADQDFARRQQVIAHNNAVDQANAARALQVATSNQSAFGKYATDLMNARIRQAMMREQANRAADEAKSANWNSFLSNLGAVGKESVARNMVNSSFANYYTIGPGGTISYKEGYDNLPEDIKKIIKNEAEANAAAQNR